MRFRNLGFIQHPHSKDSIMTQVFTDSGKRVSIVCGKGLYSSSRDGNKAECQRVEDAVSFEVLIEGEDDVRGWQSREDIDKLLAELF
jgi:hypothetical protein